MWRKVSSHLHTLASRRSTFPFRRHAIGMPGNHALRSGILYVDPRTDRPFSTYASVVPPARNLRVEDILPIATGLEREELEAELQGKKRFDMDAPVGPFGTKDAPAVIKSYYNKRIVGCPGGEGEDEHDVVWFWLEKGKPHECPVCSQYFELEVVGPGGPPDGHGDDDEHH